MFDDTKDELAEMLAEANAQKMANDPILRKAFSVGLLASDLFVAVDDEVESEDKQTQETGVSLQAVPIDDVPHVLLFSSKQKLEDFTGTSTRFARASGLHILTVLQNDFAIINPGPNGRALAPEDMAEILGKSAINPKHGEAGHVHGPNCGHNH